MHQLPRPILTPAGSPTPGPREKIFMCRLPPEWVLCCDGFSFSLALQCEVLIFPLLGEPEEWAWGLGFLPVWIHIMSSAGSDLGAFCISRSSSIGGSFLLDPLLKSYFLLSSGQEGRPTILSYLGKPFK